MGIENVYSSENHKPVEGNAAQQEGGPSLERLRGDIEGRRVSVKANLFEDPESEETPPTKTSGEQGARKESPGTKGVTNPDVVVSADTRRGTKEVTGEVTNSEKTGMPGEQDKGEEQEITDTTREQDTTETGTNSETQNERMEPDTTEVTDKTGTKRDKKTSKKKKHRKNTPAKKKTTKRRSPRRTVDIYGNRQLTDRERALLARAEEIENEIKEEIMIDRKVEEVRRQLVGGLPGAYPPKTEDFKEVEKNVEGDVREKMETRNPANAEAPIDVTGMSQEEIALIREVERMRGETMEEERRAQAFAKRKNEVTKETPELIGEIAKRIRAQEIQRKKAAQQIEDRATRARKTTESLLHGKKEPDSHDSGTAQQIEDRATRARKTTESLLTEIFRRKKP
jgi:hypothetical protein